MFPAVQKPTGTRLVFLHSNAVRPACVPNHVPQAQKTAGAGMSSAVWSEATEKLDTGLHAVLLKRLLQAGSDGHGIADLDVTALHHVDQLSVAQ